LMITAVPTLLKLESMNEAEPMLPTEPSPEVGALG
jgi:hypothetical protein